VRGTRKLQTTKTQGKKWTSGNIKSSEIRESGKWSITKKKRERMVQ
jgi:hypothetical protein